MSLTGRYFKVINGVVDGAAIDRAALRHPTVSISLNTTDAELAAIGFYPEDRTGYEPFDGATQKRSGPVYTVNADSVTAAYTVTDKTQQELDDEKAALAAGDIDTLGLKATAYGILKTQQDKGAFATLADAATVRTNAISYYKANR